MTCDFSFELKNQKENHVKCDHCCKRFETERNRNEPKQYQCVKCDKSFREKIQNKKKFHCDICDTDDTKTLKIASLNIGRGLFSKEELLVNTMEDQKSDIFSVSEVDLEDFDDKKPFSLKGYVTFFPLQRPGTSTKRLLCFVRENIDAKQRNDLMSNQLSSVWLEIKGKGQKILICTIYREFSDLTRKGQMSINDQIERLHILQSQIEQATKEGLVLCIGDMNVDISKMEDPTYYLRNLAEEYQLMIGMCGLELIDFGFTWNRQQKKSAIDHALTNKTSSIKDHYSVMIDYSDHNLICVDLDVKVVKQEQNVVTSRDYRKLRSNPKYLIKELCNIEWGTIGYMKDINDMVQFWTEEINKCLDITAPWKTRKLKKKKYVLPKEVQVLIQKRKELQKKLQTNVNSGKIDTEMEKQYKKMNNYCNKMIKKSVKEITGENISDASSVKEIWKSINIILKPENSNKKVLKIETNDRTIEDPLELAEEFNVFFKEKAEKLSNEIKNANSDPLSRLKEKMKGSKLKFVLKTVKEKSILDILNSMKKKTSYGQDCITSEILKLGSEVLVAPLTYIINTSIRSGKYPDMWKISKIFPLFKKGEKKLMQNYRPLALLSVSGMVLERVVAIQIEEYFENNKLLGNFQFGFRRKKSTISELLTLFEDLLEAKSMNKEIMILLYDLSAAYDTVSHKILLDKLKLYGFEENAIRWVKSYLENRQQFVQIAGQQSGTQNITLGTPQGSRLSPLLFICLMADMELWVKNSKLTNFADDTQSFIVEETKEKVIATTKEESSGIIDFFGSNHFVNNANKAALVYNSKGKGEEITIDDIGGVELQSSKSERLLGLYINSDLNWDTHIFELSKILRQRIGKLKRIKKKVPKNKLILIAEAIFNSKIRYGIAVYLVPVFDKEDLKDEKLSKNAKKLQTLQNDMIRTIHGIKRSQKINMERLRKKMRMMSINQMSVYHTILEMYNVYNHSSSEQILKKITHDNRHSTRSTAYNDIRVPKKQKCIGFTYYGTKLFNQLPKNIKETTNTKNFKNLVKDWIWENIPSYSGK